VKAGKSKHTFAALWNMFEEGRIDTRLLAVMLQERLRYIGRVVGGLREAMNIVGDQAAESKRERTKKLNCLSI